MIDKVLQTLLQLQAHDMESERRTGNAAVEELRRTVPVSVLQHYDRLRARGKKGVASVRRGVCGQCHMQVAHGLLAQLRHHDNLYTCENCGCYLQLVEEPVPVLEAPVRSVKPGRRGRPRKLPVHAA